MKTTQTTFMQKTSEIVRRWHFFDASNQVLGDLATKIATILIGKHKPEYTPHADNGDCVVVTNAKNVVVTGSKENDKKYYHHSGFPGGMRVRNFAWMRAHKPEEIILLAVKNMLPKNRLRSKRLARLKVYAGSTHPHQSQQSVQVVQKEIVKE